MDVKVYLRKFRLRLKAIFVALKELFTSKPMEEPVKDPVVFPPVHVDPKPTPTQPVPTPEAHPVDVKQPSIWDFIGGKPVNTPTEPTTTAPVERYASNGILPWNSSGNLARFVIPNAGGSFTHTFTGDGTPATFQVSAAHSGAMGFSIQIDGGEKIYVATDVNRVDFDHTMGTHTITVHSDNGGPYNLQVNFRSRQAAPQVAPGATRR